MQIQTQIKAATWHDGQGLSVPANRIKADEKLKEKNAYALAKQGLKINQQLADYKTLIRDLCKEVFDSVFTEKEAAKASKGNFTWFNFDRSIKIEVSINDNIDFDGLLIEKAKQKLLELVNEGISQDKAFLQGLIESAFTTSKGKLDTKRVLGLKKHAKRITDARYHEAMALIDQASNVAGSRTYYRVWLRDEHGQYQNVDLNFSSI